MHKSSKNNPSNKSCFFSWIVIKWKSWDVTCASWGESGDARGNPSDGPGIAAGGTPPGPAGGDAGPPGLGGPGLSEGPLNGIPRPGGRGLGKSRLGGPAKESKIPYLVSLIKSSDFCKIFSLFSIFKIVTEFQKDEFKRIFLLKRLCLVEGKL